MPTFEEQLIREFREQFGHLGELWNGMKGTDKEMTVESFLLEKIREAKREQD